MAENDTSAAGSHWRVPTAVLALGAFVVGTDGFIIVGLLPEIRTTLHVSTGAAGQLVSLFSLAYAILGPVLAAFTGTWSRRRVLVTGVALLAVGNAVTASAHQYGLVLVSRVLAGAGAALFMASAVATAAYLAGEERRGRAIAMVTAGATLALVLGAPLGTLIGGAWGWQAAIWFVAAIAAAVATVVAVLLPPVRLDQGATLRQRIAPLTDRRVLRILVVTLLAFTGIFLPFTYMSAVFAPAVDGEQTRLALLLLVFGVAATGGNLAAGTLADRYDPRRVVVGATAGVTAVFLAEHIRRVPRQLPLQRPRSGHPHPLGGSGPARRGGLRGLRGPAHLVATGRRGGRRRNGRAARHREVTRPAPHLRENGTRTHGRPVETQRRCRRHTRWLLPRGPGAGHRLPPGGTGHPGTGFVTLLDAFTPHRTVIVPGYSGSDSRRCPTVRWTSTCRSIRRSVR
ncbi:MFS transporter [Streptomyces achromogenes]|uniref:MFS transporter n=1 Tax=Streptomyces achromogenes TaxID=67255 RepID=UPI0036F94169